MPSTHVLKDRDGFTVADVDLYDHTSGILIGRPWGTVGFVVYPMEELTVVPRAELLAGQVIL